ncbi:hypothetical protein [Paludisphaera soli]|uniref:hypothetical protein n=1 Tax=Paludisphaera soli TaxID=2712865 RepID=UPI0013ECCCB7|nr:hypothetical protein [Paludisphaera soli]
MQACDQCGSRILFGGVNQGLRRFCGEACAHQAYWAPRVRAIPAAVIEERLRRTHEGQCPKCQGPGPVDVHFSCWVYSAMFFTRFGSRAEVCCRSCGRSNQLRDGLFSMAFGWWGLPMGLLGTPIVLFRDMVAAVGLVGPRADTPSPALRDVIEVRTAAERRDGRDAQA